MGAITVKVKPELLKQPLPSNGSLKIVSVETVPTIWRTSKYEGYIEKLKTLGNNQAIEIPEALTKSQRSNLYQFLRKQGFKGFSLRVLDKENKSYILHRKPSQK